MMLWEARTRSPLADARIPIPTRPKAIRQPTPKYWRRFRTGACIHELLARVREKAEQGVRRAFEPPLRRPPDALPNRGVVRQGFLGAKTACHLPLERRYRGDASQS